MHTYLFLFLFTLHTPSTRSTHTDARFVGLFFVGRSALETILQAGAERECLLEYNSVFMILHAYHKRTRALKVPCNYELTAIGIFALLR